jgi:hypothetical protein
MTTAATPEQIAGATNQTSKGGLFGEAAVNGISNLIAADVLAAQTSATNAATSETNAAASYDNFDDRYLGQKSSDPSTDNDGDALLTGALYFNTSNNVLMVYSGSAWQRTTPTSSDQTKINTLSAAAVLTDMDLLATSTNVTNMDTLGASGVVGNISTVAGISGNVTTVAGISANVTSVAGNSTNINAVQSNATNINTVAGINGNVTTVAGIDSDVTTVAGISGNVTTVAGISGNVTTVAGINAAVTAVNNNASNINTVSGISGNVTTVAGISGNVTSVADNETNINSAVSNSSNINTVAGSISNVNSVAGSISNVNSVAGNSTNINAVNANSSNINTVAGSDTNINTVAGVISNVNTVAGSIANVNTTATNIADVNSFANIYRIANTAPSSSLDVGDLYFDTSSDELKVYKSTGWANPVADLNASNLSSGTVPDARITGTYTGLTDLTASGVGTFGSLDISGDVDVDGTLEADAITVNGTALTSVIQGTTVANATIAATVTVTDSTANTNFPVVFHNESNGLLDDTGALRYNPSTATLLVPNLSVAGTTTSVNTVTMNAANAIVFEGATPDNNETTLTIIDPTADRTINLPNESGTIVLKDVSNNIVIGELNAVSLDVSGDADIDGTLEADAITVNGATLSSVIQEEATALAIALG